MNIAIFEDELFAREQLKLFLRRLRPQWQVVKESNSLAEAISYFNTPSGESHTPDLIFMDIELSDGSCFDIFDRAAISSPVVFTTAYDNFALQAFKTPGIDYILKPVTEESLLRAINKFEQHFARTTPRSTPGTDRVLCVAGNNYSAVPFDDIAWLRADGKYVEITDFRGVTYLAATTNLSNLASELPRDRFFQISRSFMTNVKALEKVSKQFKGRLSVTLRASGVTERVIVSSARRNAFLDWYGR
ncbi:MAG: LytTR family DNA-binding domain-containing protein [Bacteroidales bacterium]|nr:LytTR family DNA-binding domain-containing protein [Bacteroidales bacterium]